MTRNELGRSFTTFRRSGSIAGAAPAHFDTLTPRRRRAHSQCGGSTRRSSFSPPRGRRRSESSESFHPRRAVRRPLYHARDRSRPGDPLSATVKSSRRPLPLRSSAFRNASTLTASSTDATSPPAKTPKTGAQAKSGAPAKSGPPGKTTCRSYGSRPHR